MEKIPILHMGHLLLVSIQVDMHDRLALQLQDDLTNQIVKHNAKGVLIDISSLEIVDSFIGRMISNISSMARILDAETVVVGMQPAVAITLVELEGLTQQAAADVVGVSLSGMKSRVQRGRKLLRERFDACCAVALDARRLQLVTTLFALAPAAVLTVWLGSRQEALTTVDAPLAAAMVLPGGRDLPVRRAQLVPARLERLLVRGARRLPPRISEPLRRLRR